MDSRFVRPSLLQATEGHSVRCTVCERRCLISASGLGWCRTRENRAGQLVTLIYGSVSSLAPNPVEKKPFYHYRPGTSVLTAGSFSCNFDCPWCQNWEISKAAPPDHGDYLSPEAFVALTERQGCEGTSISFNEPTLSLEWSLDIFRLARPRGLYNTYVTNGYMTPESLELLIDAGLDALNVDIKGDAAAVRQFCRGIDMERVWRICRIARERGVHVELTTLVIPTVNDADETLAGIARRIADELGPAVPWHVTAYRPAYRFNAPRTPVQTLERAWAIGKEAGLEFIYVGNLPGHDYDDTHCPSCGELLIRRFGFDVRQYSLNGNRCPKCDRIIAGVWN